MVLVVSIGEKLDKATGLIGEAKAILEDSTVRKKMIQDAYLGEMGDTECFEIALSKAKEAYAILSEYRPEKAGVAKDVVDQINLKLHPPKPKPKPKEPMVEKEEIVKKPKKSKKTSKRKGVKK